MLGCQNCLHVDRWTRSVECVDHYHRLHRRLRMSSMKQYHSSQCVVDVIHRVSAVIVIAAAAADHLLDGTRMGKRYSRPMKGETSNCWTWWRAVQVYTMLCMCIYDWKEITLCFPLFDLRRMLSCFADAQTLGWLLLCLLGDSTALVDIWG